MNKRCPGCGEIKPLEKFSKNRTQRSGVQTYCKICIRLYRATPAQQREWYKSHPEQTREFSQKYYRENQEAVKLRSLKYRQMYPERVRQSQQTQYRKNKLAAFNAYGGAVCVCCGEINSKFLTIDHINGCTPAERRKQGLGSRLYHWLKKQGYPEGYQVLCFNCNLGRARNQGICPHKE